jgi:hypothetical protein
MGNFQKVIFYSSKIQISRSGYVRKGKLDLLTNLNGILKMSIQMVEIVHEGIQSICSFYFLDFLKIQSSN